MFNNINLFFIKILCISIIYIFFKIKTIIMKKKKLTTISMMCVFVFKRKCMQYLCANLSYLFFLGLDFWIPFS